MSEPVNDEICNKSVYWYDGEYSIKKTMFGKKYIVNIQYKDGSIKRVILINQQEGK